MSVIDIQEYKKKFQKSVLSHDDKLKVYASVADELIVSWDYFARKKALNDLMIDEFNITEKKDYVNDLNNLAELERIVGLVTAVFSPYTLSKIQSGYVAGFTLDEESFATPEMTSESYARAFNLLLFSYLKKALEQIKR